MQVRFLNFTSFVQTCKQGWLTSSASAEKAREVPYWLAGEGCRLQHAHCVQEKVIHSHEEARPIKVKLQSKHEQAKGCDGCIQKIHSAFAQHSNCETKKCNCSNSLKNLNRTSRQWKVTNEGRPEPWKRKYRNNMQVYNVLNPFHVIWTSTFLVRFFSFFGS